jgi:hypothetical protein
MSPFGRAAGPGSRQCGDFGRIKEIRSDTPNHLIRVIAENCLWTGADPDDQPALVNDQDQVERGFEDSLIDCRCGLSAGAADWSGDPRRIYRNANCRSALGHVRAPHLS